MLPTALKAKSKTVIPKKYKQRLKKIAQNIKDKWLESK